MVNETKKANVILAIITTLWAIMVLSAVLSACMTPKKAVGYLKKKDLLADTCAANYPVLADTIYKDGEVIVDVVYLPGDTVRKVDTVAKLERVTVTGPTKVITRTKIDTVLLTKLDSAKVAAALAENRRLQAQLTESKANTFKAESKAKNRGKMSLYSILANALLLLIVGFILAKKRKA